MPSPQDPRKITSGTRPIPRMTAEDTASKLRMNVMFDSTGKPVFISKASEPSIANTRFAKLAIESGLVSPDKVRECLEVVSRVQEMGLRKTLSECMVEKGFVTSNQALVIAAASKAGDVGGLLAGFQLMEKLGEGGMGTVYRARQVSLDRLVALKILPERLVGNQEFVARFERESKIAAKLSHPNIVGAVDAGFAGGKYYFAMEYVDGPSLKKVLNERGKLPVGEAIDVMIQMATALECAWRNNMVHRDVKPDNIMFTSEGTAKLADLGLAKEREGSSDSSVTQAGMGMGSPHYIAPEQALGRAVDIRADIYALGVSFYETVTGKLPFTGLDAMAVIMNRFDTRPEPVDKVNPEVPHAVADVIDVMMAYDPKDRHPDPRVLLHDLVLLSGGRKPEFASSNEAARKRAIKSAKEMGVRRHTTMIARWRMPWAKIGAAAAAAVVVVAAVAISLARNGSAGPGGATPQLDAKAMAELDEQALATLGRIETLAAAGSHAEVIAALDAAAGAFDRSSHRGRFDGLWLDAMRKADEAKRAAEDRAASEKRYAQFVAHARESLASQDSATALGLLIQAQTESKTSEVDALIKTARRAQHVARGDEARAAGRLEQALEQYQHAHALAESGEIADHITQLEKRIALAGRLAVAERLVAEDRYDEALQAYQQALAHAAAADRARIAALSASVATRKEYRDAMEAARGHLKAKEWNEALERAEAALAAKPDDAEAEQLAARATDELGPPPAVTDSLGIELVLVPAGTFTMGSKDGDEDERPQREVSVGSFYIGRFEITNAQYEHFSPGHRSKWKQFSPNDDMPVIAVTWEEASAFCRWLSKKEGVEYRLPTEAEWEKAARGSDRRRYPWGDTPPLAADGAWRCNLAPTAERATWRRDGFELAAPVGSFPAGVSPYGCHDMAGNVWEWCADWYAAGYYATGQNADPRGPQTGTERALRGGSLTNQAGVLTATNRVAKASDFYEANLGFRVVRVVKRHAAGADAEGR